MHFYVEAQRTRPNTKRVSLRELERFLRARKLKITKDGLRRRAKGEVPYTMPELVAIAQCLGVKVETLYELEPHEQPVPTEEARHA